MSHLRKYLSISGLLSATHQTFSRIPELGRKQKRKIKMVDCLMSALAIFGLKFPSLLQYDIQKRYPAIKKNLKKLYQVEQAPSDTYLREELDQLDPASIRPAFKKIWRYLQRGKALVPYVYWKKYYLIAIDGTGQYYSDEIFCKNCCIKHHQNGKTSYYHQMLGAVLLHPNCREVIPLAPEPIIRSDGNTKNDCERNAAKRLLNHIRREHPHLKIMITEDSLSSNGPHIQLLKELDMRFILGAKPTDHAFLFDWVNHSKPEIFEKIEQNGICKRYRWLNQVPLNDALFDCEVNFLEYWETWPNGKQLHWSWVTDIPLDLNTLDVVVRGGRARWKIENETFNTLKTQGYQFEHNFGHGENQLCSVMTMLMMLSFLIDQVQALTSELFRQAKQQAGSKQTLWEQMRVFFRCFEWESWEEFFTVMVQGFLLLDTG